MRISQNHAKVISASIDMFAGRERLSRTNIREQSKDIIILVEDERAGLFVLDVWMRTYVPGLTQYRVYPASLCVSTLSYSLCELQSVFLEVLAARLAVEPGYLNRLSV